MKHIFQKNRDWAAAAVKSNPRFFADLTDQQAPRYLWIGCSDSRVPANQICGMPPGEVFVHRNIANVVSNSDMNCLSVLQYAVEVLKVKHIIVCGHYGCGGVHAAVDDERHGMIDNWLRPIADIYRGHQEEIEALPESERLDRLCELNVRTQVINVGRSTVLLDAWARGQDVELHGIIYRLNDGILKDLDVCITGPHSLSSYDLGTSFQITEPKKAANTQG